ncbi:MAG: hypothetical protein ACI8Y4_002256 [Candidatus Poriferisodalaceae bacterium]|jgi:hypothetical protein
MGGVGEQPFDRGGNRQIELQGDGLARRVNEVAACLRCLLHPVIDPSVVYERDSDETLVCGQGA